MTDIAAEPREAAEEPAGPSARVRSRSPWLAAAMSVFVPGLGQLYAGRPWRGLAFALGGVAWSVGVLELCGAVHVAPLRIVLLLLLPATLVWVIGDAAWTAYRAGQGYVLRRYNRWYVYAALVLLAQIAGPFAFELMLRTVARAWSIPTSSMEPTLLPGDYLMASPRLPAQIARGAVVVYADAGGETYMHRVAAVPGDVVEMHAQALWINGRPVREPYVRHITPTSTRVEEVMRWQVPYLARPSAGEYAPTRDEWGPLRVPPGRYLLLGDNRDNSYDGRFKGFVPREAITGRPVWIYFSREPGGSIRWGRLGMDVR